MYYDIYQSFKVTICLEGKETYLASWNNFFTKSSQKGYGKFFLIYFAYFSYLKTVGPLLRKEVLLRCKSSHPWCSLRKGVLRNFGKFTRKHLCQSLLFNKVAGLRLATLLKKRLWHRCFPVNFRKFLRTLFLKNTSR